LNAYGWGLGSIILINISLCLISLQCRKFGKNLERMEHAMFLFLVKPKESNEQN